MNAVAFSPDGQTIATANGDGTARLWDTNTHQEVGAPLRADTSGVNALAFSPSGNSLATAGAHGIVQLWNIALPEDKYLTDAACSISGRTLKRNDWNTYIKSESFRSICPGQG
jgi:WD40 repeat protein